MYTKIVYTCIVKNVTLSADEQVIERARSLARDNKTTLNQLFRDWLEEYVSRHERHGGYRELMDRLRHVRVDRKFTREEMNARR